MRFLFVGAGGVGGYFGARLIAAGKDVTFAARDNRRAQLQRAGIVVRSSYGDLSLPARTVSVDQIEGGYDAIFISVKSYHLADAISGLTPDNVGAGQVIPLLNGIRHLDLLDSKFGPDRVSGGICRISATINPLGEVLHLNKDHELMIGARSAGAQDFVDCVQREMAGANFNAVLSGNIMQEFWNKFVLLSALAASTCLMRASLGAINRSEGGNQMIKELMTEAAGVAAAAGYPVPKTDFDGVFRSFSDTGTALKASMLRDIENGSPTEGNHIIGDMVRRGEDLGVAMPVFRIAWVNLQAYELERASRIS